MTEIEKTKVELCDVILSQARIAAQHARLEEAKVKLAQRLAELEAAARNEKAGE